eukprot:TRINITY_DN865_c0_g1_i5.p1 TRINITY_DN865_c0_g1~~TRINITY_DN865_c0_g1_i5.p1  ORF type:complete len:300 (+),score=74.57 TRINITY_DN865_c0_g1_i5:174-1073(+)
MPVTGLPVTLEKTLTALLTDNTVSSWKVAGEADNTVVVLRLKPVSKMSTTMADPVLNRHSQVQYYRKKPPSQVRRDQERAKQQQQQQQRQCVQVGHENNNDDNELPDTLFVEAITQELPSVEHTAPVHTDLSDSEPEERGDVLQDDLPSCTSDSNSSLHLQPDLHEEPAIDNWVAGFNTGSVHKYVATLTDRSVQRRLRDQQRNKLFRKTVLHQSQDRNMLLCESDDIVLEYSCDSPDGGLVMYWYVKQDQKNMLGEECVKLANLRKGKRSNNTQHAETQARALRGLHALHDLICFYLG